MHPCLLSESTLIIRVLYDLAIFFGDRPVLLIETHMNYPIVTNHICVNLNMKPLPSIWPAMLAFATFWLLHTSEKMNYTFPLDCNEINLIPLWRVFFNDQSVQQICYLVLESYLLVQTGNLRCQNESRTTSKASCLDCFDNQFWIWIHLRGWWSTAKLVKILFNASDASVNWKVFVTWNLWSVVARIIRRTAFCQRQHIW